MFNYFDRKVLIIKGGLSKKKFLLGVRNKENEIKSTGLKSYMGLKEKRKIIVLTNILFFWFIKTRKCNLINYEKNNDFFVN